MRSWSAQSGNTEDVADKSTRRSGQPSIALERRRHIVDAFIELVAERGLEGVTVDCVAEMVGVQRAAVHHYVGNREDLIAAASEEACRRYEVDVAGMGVNDAPTIAKLIPMMFGDVVTRDHLVKARAWQALLAEGLRRPDGRVVVRRAYDRGFDMVESAVLRQCPGAPAARVRDLAYVIVCLFDQNTIFQQLGYPRARQVAACDAALCLVDDLVAEFGGVAVRS